MQTKPKYMSVPTLRDYEEYKKAEQYTQGWNDAMHYIFDSKEEKQKKLHRQKVEEFKQKCTIIESEGGVND